MFHCIFLQIFLDKNANAVTKAFQNLRYGYYASVRQSFYSVVRSTHSYSLRSQLLVSHTVAKKPLQLQAKPAVKGKSTANNSLQLWSIAEQLSACRQLFAEQTTISSKGTVSVKETFTQ